MLRSRPLIARFWLLPAVLVAFTTPPGCARKTEGPYSHTRAILAETDDFGLLLLGAGLDPGALPTGPTVTVEEAVRLRLLLKLLLGRVAKGPMPFFARPIARSIVGKVIDGFVQPNLDRHLDYMESVLAKQAWFAGPEFTAADIQMSFPLEAAVARGGLDEKRPRLMDFLRRIHARPAYLKAIERGGKYELMK